MDKLNINKQWYKNKNVKPKDFICHVSYQPSGEMRVTKVFVKNKVNQYKESIQKVDARDFTQVLNSADVSVF